MKNNVFTILLLGLLVGLALCCFIVVIISFVKLMQAAILCETSNILESATALVVSFVVSSALYACIRTIHAKHFE